MYTLFAIATTSPNFQDSTLSYLEFNDDNRVVYTANRAINIRPAIDLAWADQTQDAIEELEAIAQKLAHKTGLHYQVFRVERD